MKKIEPVRRFADTTDPNVITPEQRILPRQLGDTTRPPDPKPVQPPEKTP